MKSSFITPLVTNLLIMLFAYTAFCNVLDTTRFSAVLSASPLIATGAGALAYAVAAVELAVVLLLILPRTRLMGLYASFVLLVLFTSYLGFLVRYAQQLPCSCCGLISPFPWKEHIVLNLGFLVLTGWALRREALAEQRIYFNSR